MSEKSDLPKIWNDLPEFHRKALKSLAEDLRVARYAFDNADKYFLDKVTQLENASVSRKQAERVMQTSERGLRFYLKSMSEDCVLEKEDIDAIVSGVFSVYKGEWNR